jgi:hypothetical protein
MTTAISKGRASGEFTHSVTVPCRNITSTQTSPPRSTSCDLLHPRHKDIPPDCLKASDEFENAPLDATETPCWMLWKRLGLFLRSIPLLEDLDFGFHPLENGYVNESHWRDCADPVEWHIPLSKLGEHCWRQLETLRLDGMIFGEAGLLQFLKRHASTLRNLDLYNIGLWTGTFSTLFSSLKDELSLTKSRVSGCPRGFHAHGEAWDIPPTPHLGSEIWYPEFVSAVEQYPKIFVGWDPQAPNEWSFPDHLELRDKLGN